MRGIHVGIVDEACRRIGSTKQGERPGKGCKAKGTCYKPPPPPPPPCPKCITDDAKEEREDDLQHNEIPVPPGAAPECPRWNPMCDGDPTRPSPGTSDTEHLGDGNAAGRLNQIAGRTGPGVLGRITPSSEMSFLERIGELDLPGAQPNQLDEWITANIELHELLAAMVAITDELRLAITDPGIRDAIACAQGDKVSCAFAAVGVIPYAGKLATAARVARAAHRAGGTGLISKLVKTGSSTSRAAPPPLLNARASGSGPRLPMTMKCVCEVAAKHGIDITDLRIKIDKSRMGYAGSTGPDQLITLTRSAFKNEEQLARTLAHERFHVEQLRSGITYPVSRDAARPWEDAAERFEDWWWHNH